MDERFLEDIVSGIDDKYVNETASALYENESRNVTSSDDLVIVEKKNKKFPFALVSAAAVVIAVISVVVGVVIFNGQSINTLDGSQKQEYPLFHEEMLAVKKDGKWGYINKSGEWTIEPQFDEACAFQKNGYAIVGIETKNDKGSETMIYGLIDKSGSYVIEPQFDLLYPFDDNGLALAKNNGNAGYIDISGNYVIEPVFRQSRTHRFFSSDYATVSVQVGDDYKAAVIDSKGNYVIEPIYDEIFILENGLFEVQLTDVIYESTDEIGMTWERGIIDKDGNFILPIEFFEILRGEDGIYAVQCYGDAYHVDKDGKPLYNQRFSHVSIFNEYGVAEARTKDDSYGLIDKNGNYIAEPVYDYIINWGSFGTYVVKKDGKYGFINYKNEKITDFIFEDAQIFSENGLAIVVKDGKYGCININGEFAVQPIYLSISSFTDGVAVAETKDGFILINEKGERITSKTYGYLGKIKNERVAFYDGKKTFGYLDYSGNVIFSQVFGEDVSLWVNPYSDDGYTVVNSLDNEGKIKGLGVIDHEGNFTSDLSFGGYYTYEYVEEIIGHRDPDIIIKISEDEKKDNIPIAFPSSPVNNKIYAHYVITENMAITAENVDTWLPYSYVRDPNAPDWYITKNEKNQMILKCGKRPTVDVDGVYGPEADICIGDDSLKNYSLEIKFRFAEGDLLYFSLYESTLRSEADIPDANYTLDMCFMLTDNGKLYKWTPRYEELITELGELDKNKWYTLTIDNIDGSLQLILDNEKKGEIYKVTTNEYGSFGFGGYTGVEIMSITIDDVELNTDVENTESDENSTPETTLPESDENSTPETTLPESDENSTPETTLPDNEDKPVSAITFPSSSHTNDITAYQVITDGMKLNAENIDLWLPYADNTGSSYLEWYITENENGENIIKSGKCPQIMPPTGGNLSPEIYIGDSSLKNYSLLVDFRFGNVDTIKIGLYKDTFTTESDFSADEPMLGWFELNSDGKLYRTGVFSTRELITDIGEIDKDSYHTIQIENKGGSLQLIFDEKNYGEIAKVNDNQYGAFGIGGFELEVREMAVYDIEKYDAPIFDFSHLPQKLQSEFLKAGIGTDIEDRERIGLISAFVTGDASLLPEDTDEDVRKVFEEIYSTIVIKDYFIDVADDSLHFIASYQGQSIVKPYDEYAIYDFDKPAVNLTHDDRYTGGSYVDYITDNTHSSNADMEFEIIRVNYSLDGRTTENVARIFKKGDRLHITEEYIHVYTFTQSGNCGTEPSEPPSILSSEEFWQTKTESDLSYDYLGSTELTLSAEEVIYAYQKYLNEQNWELLNVLWYGNEMKWCGSKGDAESMFSDMKITNCKNVTEEEYADRFNTGINELIYHITYESDSKGEGSMFIMLKKDGANYYIAESFTE